jgi:hypothetical protein
MDSQIIKECFGIWKHRKEIRNVFKVWKELKNKKMIKKIFKKSTYYPKKAKDSLDRVFKKIQDPNTHFNELQVRYFQKNVIKNVPLLAHTVLIVYKDSKSIFCYDNDVRHKFNSETIVNFLNEIKKGEIVDIYMNAVTTDNHYGYPEFYTIKAFP